MAAVRHAIRVSLASVIPVGPRPANGSVPGPAAPLALVACSGGADSLALAAGLAFVAPRLGLRGGGITIDHGLQPGSADQAARAVATMAGLGLDPVRMVAVRVPGRDTAGPYPGPEAAARAARYQALDAAADDLGAVAILLGHTMDDQAETVLLGLSRGSGARSLAGMAPVSGRYLRPLLGMRRARIRDACLAAGLEPWDDPQNESVEYARVRVRRTVLPALEDQLGPGVTEALARTAAQLRADADALDQLAAAAAEPDLTVAGLAGMPAAIRSRVLRNAAIAAGAPPGALTARHVADLDALVTSWRGQRWADLPGGVQCRRRYDRLLFTADA